MPNNPETIQVSLFDDMTAAYAFAGLQRTAGDYSRRSRSNQRGCGGKATMIYLSGALRAELIGERKDIGIMMGFRSDGKFYGKSARFNDCLWAADNGCFTNPDLHVGDYLQWLAKMKIYQETCLFATAPDVVGDADETWKRSKEILPSIRDLGYPAALVAQDGIENKPIHWDEFDCLFIGGSTEWKLSHNAFWLCREAIKNGKWVHMGRVNSFRRMLIARFAGCHSTDGTQLAFAPDQSYAQLTKWMDFIESQPVLSF